MELFSRVPHPASFWGGTRPVKKKEFDSEVLAKVRSTGKLLKTRVKIFNVTGIFEIPVAIKKNIKKFDAFVALGCVIKGKTPHFDFICKSTFDAIMNLSFLYNKHIK